MLDVVGGAEVVAELVGEGVVGGGGLGGQNDLEGEIVVGGVVEIAQFPS